MNQFKYSLDNKRYHTYNYYLKNKYHQKVAKVALNADFTCPNRDGSKGYGENGPNVLILPIFKQIQTLMDH